MKVLSYRLALLQRGLNSDSSSRRNDKKLKSQWLSHPEDWDICPWGRGGQQRCLAQESLGDQNPQLQPWFLPTWVLNRKSMGTIFSVFGIKAMTILWADTYQISRNAQSNTLQVSKVLRRKWCDDDDDDDEVVQVQLWNKTTGVFQCETPMCLTHWTLWVTGQARGPENNAWLDLRLNKAEKLGWCFQRTTTTKSFSLFRK